MCFRLRTRVRLKMRFAALVILISATSLLLLDRENQFVFRA
jgi:hypothetical protein